MACTQYLGFSDLPTIYNISQPVGPNMPNSRDDVLLVQTLIRLANLSTTSIARGSVEGSADIQVDGWFGDQTKRMIEAFERCVRDEHLLLATNGIIEPSSSNGYTPQGIIYKIIHLNRFAKRMESGSKFNEMPTDPDTHPMLRESLLIQRNPDALHEGSRSSQFNWESSS